LKLSPLELNFLYNYINIDEHGVLFLFQKTLYTVLKCKLASQLIVALYKPGAFISFFQKVLAVVSKKGSIFTSPVGIITLKTNIVIRCLTVTGLTLGVSLYSGI
jgi:hypothetical protein